MASITSEIASSSSSWLKWKYDAFVSFRDEDTGNNFTDHLYAALDQKDISTFRDNERLERGKFISTELLDAIEKSRFAIIVLSRNYASSSRCLNELVKIVECKEEARLTVLPVFYDVDPSDVRKQTGSFAEAFAKHEDLIKNEEKLRSWRAALSQVANLSGWDARNKRESTIIKEIVGEILGDLNASYSYVHKDLVGIKSRVGEIEDICSSMGLNDVRFIGIWGMGGVGKTTLARVLYDKIHSHFDGSSFLPNVRERSENGGLVSLQKQLLSDVLFESNIDILDAQQGINVIMNRLCCKKVLVILDDVDQLIQLETLVGKRSWFGHGSVIIMTTRDQHLLLRHGVAKEEMYKATLLNDDEALKLFSLKAFKQDYPLKGYLLPSQKVIYYARGLPLALEILGSFLFDRNLNAWESLLGRLRECPESKISDVLQIGFDGLRSTEKKVFLDIACFLKGMTRDRVAHILQTPYYKPYIDIDVLVEKSFITISDGTLWMHDLLQELGKEIVRCESPDEPGGRSRLWLKEDILQGLPLALKVLGSFTRDRNLDAWESDLAWKAFKTFVIVQIQQNKMFEISKGCVNHRQFWANGCISLESLLPLKMNDDSGGSLYLLNCFQFVENQDRCDLCSTMLREYFQELRYRESTNKGIFEVFLPGSEVPNWFRHQSVGASINLELPSYLFKQIRGIAFCAIFRHHQHRGYDCYSLLYHIKPDGKDFCLYQQYFSGEFDTFESDHCWFIYLCPSFSIYT